MNNISPNNKYDGIISVNEHGTGFLVMMLTEEHWKIQSQQDFDPLPETEYKDVLPGLYYANIKGSYCGGNRCSNYECPGDCFETEWEIVESITTIEDKINSQ